MSLFINVIPAIKRHLTSFRVEDPSGRPHYRWGDLAVQFGAPLVASGLTFAVPGRDVDLSGLLAGIALVAGALVGLAVLMFELQLGRSNSGRIPRSLKVQQLIDQLFHNSVYAAVVAGLVCFVILLVDIFPLGRTGFAIVAFLGVHLGVVGLMCIKRISQAYVELRKEQDERAASRFTEV